MSQQSLFIAVATLNGQGFNFHSALQSFQPPWPTSACARAHARKKNSARSHSQPFQTLWPSLACSLLSEISFSLTHLSSRLHPSYRFKPWGKSLPGLCLSPVAFTWDELFILLREKPVPLKYLLRIYLNWTGEGRETVYYRVPRQDKIFPVSLLDVLFRWLLNAPTSALLNCASLKELASLTQG